MNELDAPGENDSSEAPKSNRGLAGCASTAVGLLLLPVAFFTLIAFLGRFHWAIELTTHFRFQYFAAALLLLPAFLLLRRTRAAIFTSTLILMNGLLVLPVYFPVETPAETTRSIRILFSNVYLENEDYESIRSVVRETQPDIILFAETHKRWTDQLDKLKSEYPYSVYYRSKGAVAICGYSRKELDKLEVQWVGDPPVPIVVAQTKLNGQPIKIIGAHAESPGSAEALRCRTSQMQQLATMAAEREMPTAIIGDLNVTPWSPFFTEMLQQGELRDSRRGFGNHASWQTGIPPLRIPIDHCLVTEKIVVERREICRNVGSDHFPLLVELSIRIQKDSETKP